MDNNSTKVNVDIGASGSYKGVVQGAMSDFSNLWSKIGEGKIATGIAVAGFAGLAIGVSAAVKQAGDFQASMTRLTTSAGESAANLKQVHDGVLQIANATGTSTQQLSDAMYVIESAGQHGADGLTVLKAAAQGAKTENADLKTVADAVSSVLQDYHLKAKDSADVTSKLVAAVGTGKTTFQELAGSLHSVLPIASSANISLSDVTGALASMTVHGMSADQASQNLADTIKHMVAPTQVQTKELGQLGISSGDLAGMLGQKGITGTLQDLSETILKKMGPSGKVMLDSFNQSKDAANDANIMISKMPISLQGLAKEYQNGKISLGDYRKALKDLPTDQANLMQQFGSLENRAKGFNDLLNSGQPAAQTYQDALRRVTGDATGLNTALMLTGENTKYVNNAVKTIAGSTTEAGGNVKGWSEVQKTFNQQLAVAKEHFQVLLIQIGDKFLPILTAILGHMDGFMKVLSWVAPFVGGIVAVVMAMKTWEMIINAVKMAQIALTIVMNFNPIMLAIMAVAAIALVVLTHWNQVKQWFGDFINWLKQHWQLVVDILFGPIGIVVTMIIDHWKQITKLFDDFINWLSSHWEVILGILTGPFGLAVVWVIQNWNKITAFFSHLGSDIKHAIGDVSGMLYDVGKSLIDGLINGVKSMIGKAGSAVKDIGKEAVSGIKSLLGIHSPSTVFAEIGQNMGAGLIQGLQGIKAQANVAVTGLVTGSNLVNSNGAPSSNVTSTVNNNSVNNSSAQHTNIGTLVIQAPNGATAQSIFRSLNQDTINLGKGLSPVQGGY